MGAMTPHFFAQQKEKWETKEKKERVLKQELLKVCHQGQNVTFVGILGCLEFKKLFFLVNHGLWKFFSVFYASPLSPAFKKLISETNRTSCLEVFCKKSGLRNFAKFTGKHHTCARVSLLIKLQAEACSVISKETLWQLFSCEFCEFSKNTISYRTPPVAASEGKLQVMSFA